MTADTSTDTTTVTTTVTTTDTTTTTDRTTAITTEAQETTAAAAPESANRTRCVNSTPTRRPHFGDLHVHTGWSFDANAQDTRNSPADAYRFARGEEVAIQPYNLAGEGQRKIQIDRPLDFAAVTDHAEFLGEMKICREENTQGYNHPACIGHRELSQISQLLFGGYGLSMKRRWGLCGEDNQHCLDQAKSAWEMMQEAAEQAYDRSEDCQFTSFIGYEWTATVGRGNNLHHNVIFKNDQVPDYPLSWIESPTQVQLWDYLEQTCVDDTPGCDGIAIPHNSNLSGGLQFETARLATTQIPEQPDTAEEAARRSHWTPLIEMMQHKGSSECDSRLPVWADDTFCGFEKLGYANFGTKNTGDDGSGVLFWLKTLLGGGEFSDIQPPGEASFVRYALKKGLRQQRELGSNGYKYGFISSTDTHIAAPGLAMEKNHPGHGGAGMGSREGVALMPDELEFNPGGLAVLYAEENTRESLFAAMRRREAYATTGTRPTLRFFGGWQMPENLCESSTMLEQAYSSAVPMGAELPEPGMPNAMPRFLVSAAADAGTVAYPGSALQRIQIVKGWYDGDQLREQVLDVAGGDNNAAVDINTCEQSGPGHAQLCTVWEDSAFKPSQEAFYYARLLENPSCRWSQQICVAQGVRCDDPSTIVHGLESCCAAEHVKTIQERAWSSPIWYTPATAN
ncbi:MAG: DUF3604 domain-containing protein [Gammaproteobacteria bacterium]|nr:DUF3604 domain-containing protein [Gammaproteobacteria bacterium]